MEINVSQQLKAHIGNVREYEVSDVADILGTGISVLVEGKVKLTRTNRGILVNGTMHTKVPTECSRCLKTFDFPLSFNIEEEYFPVIDVNSGVFVEIPDEPGSFTIDEHHILDLSEAIRQNALLTIPMKPLCRDDCAGLCTNCGKDLNEGQCECGKEAVDQRWSKLVKLTAAGKNIKNLKKEME
jgi:uncharacterized protein